MSRDIHIQNPHNHAVDEERLRRAADAVLNRLRPASACEMTIVLADDGAIKQMNHHHRGIDCATDVLSFPADPLPKTIAKGPRYLGDILIAFPYTSAKSQRNNLDLRDVLALLVIHGTLHLLGHHHADDASRQTMWAEQARALASLHIDPAIAAAYEDAHED